MGVNIYEAVKQAIQDIVAPSLRSIEGQIETTRVELRSEIRRLDDKIEGLDKRIDSLRSEFSSRFESLEREISTAIDIHERLAAVEAKLANIH